MRTTQNVISFVFYLWTGQLSAAFTYWVVGIFGNFALFCIPLYAYDGLGTHMTAGHIALLGVSAVYFLFSAVCVTRSVGTADLPKIRMF